MQAERLKILRELVKEEPDDPFNAYALAIELKKSDKQESIKLLKKLSKTNSDYLPTFYQLGELLTNEEDYEDALAYLDKGIALAQKLKDVKTEKELLGAKQLALDEMQEW